MKISYMDLEACLQNPAKWVAEKLNPNGSFPRQGYAYCLQEGIYYFHKHNDSAKAKQHLLEALTKRNLHKGIRIEEITSQFDAYVLWANKTKVKVAAYRFTLNYELVEGIVLGGSISRIDITPEGHRGILLRHMPNDWDQQFHMPLIQRALAKQFHRSEEKFSVGYQKTDGSELTVRSFPLSRLDEAERIARELAGKVAVEVQRLSNTS